MKQNSRTQPITSSQGRRELRQEQTYDAIVRAEQEARRRAEVATRRNRLRNAFDEVAFLAPPVAFFSLLLLSFVKGN